MLKEERYDKILEILEKETYASAQKLSTMLYASLPTIRRDLSELQKRGLIIRSHGGARKGNTERNVLPIDFRKTVNYSTKRELCKIASNLINNDDIIFIDASTTSFQIADFISDKKNITVVTNSIILSTIFTKQGVKNFCAGGELQQNSMCYAGGMAEEIIRNFNFDKIFFSSYGVSDKNVIVDISLPETMLRKTAIKQSKEKIFLCDKSKFNMTASYNLLELKDVDYIVTDKEDIKSIIKSDDIKVLICE